RALRQRRQDRLHLGAEQQAGAVLGAEERQDARPVPGEDQPAARAVPERERELAMELPYEVQAVVFVERDEDFRIGTGPESVAPAFEFGPRFQIIEDLAVEDHLDGAVLV